MTIQFEKSLNADQIWDKIQNTIINQKFNYNLWKKVESILTKFDNQKISKRIETTLKKELPGYSIFYKTNYGMFQIEIWNNEINYDNRKSFLIGYSTNPILNMTEVKKFNTCWELEKIRSEKLESITKKELENQVNNWNNGLNKLQSVNKWSSEFEINYMNFGFDLK